jgi:hypothetical protein
MFRFLEGKLSIGDIGIEKLKYFLILIFEK